MLPIATKKQNIESESKRDVVIHRTHGNLKMDEYGVIYREG